jgi:hypothetical protein
VLTLSDFTQRKMQDRGGYWGADHLVPREFEGAKLTVSRKSDEQQVVSRSFCLNGRTADAIFVATGHEVQALRMTAKFDLPELRCTRSDSCGTFRSLRELARVAREGLIGQLHV